jgi:uncharacterized membrane protein YedE/YeeE
VLLGAAFGIVLAQGEIVSWYRIQEMFRFQSFHMYGVLGSAVLVAGLFIAYLRRQRGESPFADKDVTPRMTRYWAGGTIFGLGWALLGACPGPLYILVGHGETAYLVPLVSALVGTWTYGRLRPKLPH